MDIGRDGNPKDGIVLGNHDHIPRSHKWDMLEVAGLDFSTSSRWIKSIDCENDLICTQANLSNGGTRRRKSSAVKCRERWPPRLQYLTNILHRAVVRNMRCGPTGREQHLGPQDIHRCSQMR